MMRSMFTGVSGLRVHQTKMDVIANNIANVNTVGFKSSRVTFADVFNQTLQHASGPQPSVGRGGINPMQVGLGAQVASIDLLMTTGAAQRTDDPFHVMIQGGGNGFFVVGDNSGTFYTRAGAFRMDEWNQLTIPNGMLVHGWRGAPNPGDPSEIIFDRNAVVPIALTPADLRSPPEATTRVNLTGNLNIRDADETRVPDGIRRTVSFFDSLGNQYNMDFNFVFVPERFEGDPPTQVADTGRWIMEAAQYIRRQSDGQRFHIDLDVSAAARTGQDLIDTDNRAGASPFDMGITIGAPLGEREPAPARMAFSAAGTGPDIPFGFTTSGDINWEAFSGFVMNFDATNLFPYATIGTAAGNIYLDMSGGGRAGEGLTQYGHFPTDALADALDGRPAGNLIGISIGPDGVMRAAYDNDTMRALFQIPLATFANHAGLARAGNNLFQVTANSGAANIGEAQSGGNSLMGGVLEMSNVDLSFEFTEMITTQRGFQANSRIISVSDEMLAELVNLRR